MSDVAQPEKVTPDAASWLRNLEVRAVNFSITWGMGGSYAKMLAAFAAQEIAAQPLAAPVETKPDWCQGADAICHHPACACVPWDTAAPVETDEIAALKAEVERLRDAKRRALALADEHGKELAALRLARSSAGNVGLKPCPHCGGRADFNNDGERWDQVICDSCGCRGCEYPNNREKAAAAWNLRSEALSATEGNDLLGEMKHGHAEPVADRHYAWAVAEITGLRQKVSRLIDEASHTDLRASGGLFPDEPQAVAEWHLVETAPKDVEVLMCWEVEWPERRWEYASGLWGSTRGGWNHGQATHWMPLPSSPLSRPHGGGK